MLIWKPWLYSAGSKKQNKTKLEVFKEQSNNKTKLIFGHTSGKDNTKTNIINVEILIKNPIKHI